MKKTTLGGIVVCLALLFAVSSVAPAQADWSMTRGNANHTGVGSGNPILKPTLLWNFTLNCTVGTCSIADGVLYFGASNGTIYALNASTGAQIWSKTLPDHEGFGAPAIGNGLLFISSHTVKPPLPRTNVWATSPPVSGLLDAISSSTGEKLWNLTFKDKYVSEPTVNAGHVYVACTDQLYAFDDHTGTVVWSKYTGELFSPSPAATNSVVYSTGISALSAYNGNLLWNRGNMGTSSAPTVYEGIVYHEHLTQGITAFNITTGDNLWSYSTQNRLFASPAVFNGTIYFVSNDDNLYAVEACSGTKLWNYSMGPHATNYSPTVAGGIVYLRSYFFFGGTHYDLYAFNASSGGKLWSLNMTDNNEKGNLADPVVDNGVLYISLGNSICAFVDESAVPSIPQTTTSAYVFWIAIVAVGIVVAVGLVIFMLYWKIRQQKKLR